MKGYVYTMYKGADPGKGWQMTDPIFGEVPTLGACMPNIRRFVERGDYIFVVSGRVERVQQYIVGGFKVNEKINALAAYGRFPKNRMSGTEVGKDLQGNIICDANGKQYKHDYHDGFEKRLENYIVGCDPVLVETPREVELARARTLPFVKELFDKPEADAIKDVVTRWRKLDEDQIDQMLGFFDQIKLDARKP